MSIDRADWHWDSAEELYRKVHCVKGELTEEQEEKIWLLAANHIGLFLKWIIDRGFEGDESDKDECEKVKNGQMSGTEFLLENCDGKFWDSDIREDILPFIKFYYESNDYFADYGECCLSDPDKPCYGVISDETDYLKLKAKIDAAYNRFLAENPE